MNGLDLRRALTEAADWTWYGDYACNHDAGHGEQSLYFDMADGRPLSFDDVMAACRNAGYESLRLRRGDWRARGKEWRADILLDGDPLFSFAYGPTELDAIALALIAAHRERARPATDPIALCKSCHAYVPHRVFGTLWRCSQCGEDHEARAANDQEESQ